MNKNSIIHAAGGVERFMQAWNTSTSREEVAQKLGMTLHSVKHAVSTMRSWGIEIPTFHPNQHVKKKVVVVEPTGKVNTLYDEKLPVANMVKGKTTTQRAASVEPHQEGWMIYFHYPNLGPIGPFELRSEALEKEQAVVTEFLIKEI